MARVFIPPLLRTLTGGADVVAVEGANLRQVVAALDERFPGIRGRLCDGDRLKSEIAVAVDGNVTLRGLVEKVGPDSEVHFLPPIGGG